MGDIARNMAGATAGARWGIAAALVVAGVALTLLPPRAALAADYTVCAAGCDYVTLAAAIADGAVVNGDVLTLMDATHVENGVTVAKDVTVRGLGAAATTLDLDDGDGDDGFTVGAGRSVTIEGLTFAGQGGAQTAVVATDATLVTLRDVETGAGGDLDRLVLATTSTVVIEDSTIAGFFTDTVVRASVTSTVTVRRVAITGADVFDAALHAEDSTLDVIDSLLEDIDGSAGGAIWASDSTLTVTRSILRNNNGGEGGAIRTSDTAATVRHSIFEGNTDDNIAQGVQPDDIHVDSGLLDARYNWWGADAQPDATRVTDPDVDVSTWLSSVDAAPSNGTPSLGGDVDVTATLRGSDASDQGAGSGLSVRFERVGVNAGGPVDDLAAPWVHTYAGANLGADTVTATLLFGPWGAPAAAAVAVAALSDAAAVTWQAAALEDFEPPPLDPVIIGEHVLTPRDEAPVVTLAGGEDGDTDVRRVTAQELARLTAAARSDADGLLARVRAGLFDRGTIERRLPALGVDLAAHLLDAYYLIDRGGPQDGGPALPPASTGADGETTFDLTFVAGPTGVPAGAAGDEFVVAWYDVDAGRWVILDATVALDEGAAGDSVALALSTGQRGLFAAFHVEMADRALPAGVSLLVWRGPDGTPIERALEGLASASGTDAIFVLDAGVWRSYVLGAPPFAQTLASLRDGQVLLVRADAPATWRLPAQE